MILMELDQWVATSKSMWWWSSINEWRLRSRCGDGARLMSFAWKVYFVDGARLMSGASKSILLMELDQWVATSKSTWWWSSINEFRLISLFWWWSSINELCLFYQLSMQSETLKKLFFRWNGSNGFSDDKFHKVNIILTIHLYKNICQIFTLVATRFWHRFGYNK